MGWQGKAFVVSYEWRVAEMFCQKCINRRARVLHVLELGRSDLGDCTHATQLVMVRVAISGRRDVYDRRKEHPIRLVDFLALGGIETFTICPRIRMN